MKVIITDKELFNNRALLPKKEKAAWLKALMSGKYEKGTGYLQLDNRFCCLGVLCHIQKLPTRKINRFTYYDEEKNLLSCDNPFYSILGRKGTFSGFRINKINNKNDHMESLVEVNDYTNSFDEVIEVIKKYF
jgi:hypothetical protein